MSKHGKKYRQVMEKAPKETLELNAALAFLKENPVATFDETVELCLRMGLDPKKSDNSIRSTVSLPHGTGKSVKVLVFAAGEAADAAREAGADLVGMDDMIEKVKGGWTDFDVAIATPEAMKEVRKLGRVLGPRGLMPNPKTGTVTDDTAQAVKESQGGRVEFRMDRQANIHLPVGKLSFDVGNLVENVEIAVAAIRAERPAAAKGIYIKHISLSSTMGVGISISMPE